MTRLPRGAFAASLVVLVAGCTTQTPGTAINKLGSSNNAKVLRPFMVAVATDERGFLTQLTAMRESLAHAEEAIKAAMANYRESDAENANQFKGPQ